VNTSSASANASFTASSTASSRASSTASLIAPHSSGYADPVTRGGHAGPIAGGVIGGIAIISFAVAAIFYLRRRGSRAASADVNASQLTLNDGTVARLSSGSPPAMKFYVRVFMSHAAPVMCPHAPFSYHSHTPRTQMTQLRSRDTKAVHHLWTSFQLLKYPCHRTSDPEVYCQTCGTRCLMPGDIVVYPSPVLDPAHLAIA
jgi:hypothetical protein